MRRMNSARAKSEALSSSRGVGDQNGQRQASAARTSLKGRGRIFWHATSICATKVYHTTQRHRDAENGEEASWAEASSRFLLRFLCVTTILCCATRRPEPRAGKNGLAPLKCIEPWFLPRGGENVIITLLLPGPTDRACCRLGLCAWACMGCGGGVATVGDPRAGADGRRYASASGGLAPGAKRQNGRKHGR